MPGGVIAVGLIVPFATFDNALDAFMREQFGIPHRAVDHRVDLAVGDGLCGAVHGPPRLALTRAASRQYMPIWMRPRGRWDKARWACCAAFTCRSLTPSLLTGLLIVFVDVMKELPATLILRPFNFDTLAVQAHRLAADERLEGAAVPSLVIMAVGLLPVILICRQVGRQANRR